MWPNVVCVAALHIKLWGINTACECCSDLNSRRGSWCSSAGWLHSICQSHQSRGGPSWELPQTNSKPTSSLDAPATTRFRYKINLYFSLSPEFHCIILSFQAIQSPPGPKQHWHFSLPLHGWLAQWVSDRAVQGHFHRGGVQFLWHHSQDLHRVSYNLLWVFLIATNSNWSMKVALLYGVSNS